MQQNLKENICVVIEPTATAAPSKTASTPATGPKETQMQSEPPKDYSDEDNSEGVFEVCKAKRLATFHVDEDTVCCVGAASSQCCLKDRDELCATNVRNFRHFHFKTVCVNNNFLFRCLVKLNLLKDSTGKC
jgi:hypothetical protein